MFPDHVLSTETDDVKCLVIPRQPRGSRGENDVGHSYLAAPEAAIGKDALLAQARGRGEVLRVVNRGRKGRSRVRGHDSRAAQEGSRFAEHALVGNTREREREGDRRWERERESPRGDSQSFVERVPPHSRLFASSRHVHTTTQDTGFYIEAFARNEERDKGDRVK